MDIIAPTYKASLAFTQPVALNMPIGVDDVSIGDLIRAPATLAILNRLAPALVQGAQAPAMNPYIENFTIRHMVSMTPGNQVDQLDGLLAKIDAALRALPQSERPRYE